MVTVDIHAHDVIYSYEYIAKGVYPLTLKLHCTCILW